jgi:ATP-binding cassette subfamily B multidrug efflux pump
MRRILEFIRPYRRDALAALLLVVLMTGVELAIPGLIQRIIDLGIVAQNMTVVRDTTLWMLAAGLASALLTIGNTVLAVRVTSYVTTDMRSAIFSKIQSFSFSNLDRFHTGWLLVRLTNDVNMLGYIIMMSLRVFLRAPLRLVGSYLLMILISPRLALVMPVLMMATAGIVMLMVRRGHPLFLAVQRKLDWLNTILQENLAGVRVVKAFARAEHEAERFETANAELMTHSMRVMQLFSVLVPTLVLLLNLSSGTAVSAPLLALCPLARWWLSSTTCSPCSSHCCCWAQWWAPSRLLRLRWTALNSYSRAAQRFGKLRLRSRCRMSAVVCSLRM